MWLAMLITVKVRQRKKKKTGGRRLAEKNLGEADFFPTLTYDFVPLKAWNPPLFIMGGRGTLCLYWGQILALNSIGKDLNHWLKGVIMVC